MRIQDGYIHAHYRYDAIGVWHYIVGLWDLLIARLLCAKNITFHFPLEIALVSHRHDLKQGLWYMSYIEWVASLLNVQVVWENIAFLSTIDWSLVEQMNWDEIPNDVYLCLDTGHLMLGSKNPQKIITKILNMFGNRVKHLHIHENDLIHDLHKKPHVYLTPKFILQITKGRTWIFEPPS